MQVSVSVSTPSVVTPPPTTVSMNLTLSMQEAKLLRAMLGNTSYQQHEKNIADAIYNAPAQNNTALVQTEGRRLAEAISNSLQTMLNEQRL